MKQMRIKGVGHLRVGIVRQGRRHGTIRRLVKTYGTLAGSELAAEVGLDEDTIKHLVHEIIRVVRAGYEVRLGTKEDCVRFYPVLDRELKTMFLSAQTMGKVRDSVRNLGFDLYREGEQIEQEDAEELSDNVRDKYNKTEYIAVTPDMVITCPKCGFDKIRVGKALAQKEKNEE